MEEVDAIVLLLKSAMINDKSVDAATTAQKLVSALGYIPLAIDQAAAYVQSCGCELAYYLELFIKHCVKLMSDKEFHGASLYNHSTYEAWDISIEEIKRRAGGQNSVQSLAAQSALTLHNLFAFLHQDNISREIFKNAALNFMKRKGRETNGLPQTISLLDSRTLLLDADGNWDALQFQAGIKVLLSFSLIRSNGMLYSVHPLIQTWSRDRISLVNVSDCCKKSRALLACSLDFRNQEDDYRFCSLLAPHIRTNGGHAAQLVSNEQYFDDQNHIFALVFFMVGDWDQAEKLWRETSHARETRLGEKHPDTLTTMSNLALTYSNQGKQKEAESLQVKVMEASKEIHGPLHPDTLTAMGNLALTYSNQGKWKEAESLQVKVMEASKEILGPLHPDTLMAMGNLALTYSNQGKWKEAESLQVKVMEASKEILGPLHPDTLMAMGNLALTYRNQGKWKEAESLQVKVMEASKEILGPLHPDTLTTMGNLAGTYSNQGKWKEAESLQVKVMEASKEILGPLHPGTLMVMGNLALTYSNQGKWKEAESLQVKVMEAGKKICGALHPDTLTAMGNLAGTYSNQGKWKEAESLQVKVMEASKEILGPLHPDTLTAMGNLAVTYSNQGKWKEAESLQVKVMEAGKKICGALHPDTLVAMGNLALIYRAQNQVKDANEMLQASINSMQQVLGVDHPTTVHYMHQVQDEMVSDADLLLAADDDDDDDDDDTQSVESNYSKPRNWKMPTSRMGDEIKDNKVDEDFQGLDSDYGSQTDSVTRAKEKGKAKDTMTNGPENDEGKVVKEKIKGKSSDAEDDKEKLTKKSAPRSEAKAQMSPIVDNVAMHVEEDRPKFKPEQIQSQGQNKRPTANDTDDDQPPKKKVRTFD
ncbi:hypothetical protein JOM56_010714 [Amanita muscaria]